MTWEKLYDLTATAARWLMLLYVVVLPIVRPLDIRLLGIHIFATDLIFAVAFLLWLVSLVQRKPSFNLRYFGFVGFFFLALTASALFSTELQKSLLKLSGVFYLIAVSAVVADMVQDVGFLKRITYAWLAGSVITILGTIAGLVGFFIGYDSMATNFFLFHSGSLPPGDYPRVMAFFENPNMSANYANIIVMLVLAAAKIGWIAKPIGIIVAVVLFVATVFTVSPGIGGMILSVGLWIYFVSLDRERGRGGLVLVGACFIALVTFAVTVISPKVRDIENAVIIPIIERPIEPSVRFLVWKNSLERAMEYPILGRGTGTDAASVRYQVISGQDQLLRDAHQAWLNIFGQAGLIGLTAFVALCWYLFSICRFRLSDSSERLTILVTCSCAFVGAFLFQNLSGSFEDARQLWVLIGMLVGLATSSKEV